MRKTSRLFSIIPGIFLLLCSQCSFSQSDTSFYFFDEKFNLSADTAAINTGIAIKQQDSTWQIIVANTVTKRL